MPLLLFFLAALGFAPAPVFRERAKDPEAILGGWRGVSNQHNGRNQMGTAFRV